ncbi:hypothetical protein G5647_14635 [Pectobacterium carotovorum]|uniref:hypothetical protein n=1 Tax=Pectobacterium carotovorum TaxID=554 RepID=UPI00191ED60F|nr:hypothetical protein [Pectobacterium carotovorum]MBL0867662.1 hypothetical protein [Pectobacterium carotovorum]
MKNGLYSVTDKALFDALIQSKVTHENMKDLFFKRGIIISKHTSKKSLASDFSRYFHGFGDYDKLSNILGSVGRREKSTTNIINGGVTRPEVESALKETVSVLKKEGDIVTFSYVENEGIEVTIKYIKLDYKLSEFRQSSTREAKILIEPTTDGLFQLRFPPNNKSQSFVKEFTKSLKAINEVKDISIDEITLESVKDPVQRTNFFKRLIDNIDTYERMDVTDVYVSHQDIEAAKKNSAHDDSEDEDSEDEIEVETGYHISKASLKGRGVLDSPELNNFLSKEFYITRIIWTAKVKGFPDSDMAEFEAQFVDSEKCTLFSYLVRGYYKYKSQTEFRETRTSFGKENEKLISTYIERAARDISNDIVSANAVSVKTD